MKDVVILRRWRNGRSIIALFPEEPAEQSGSSISSYEHVGQHGSADYGHVMQQTTRLYWLDEEALALLNELRDRGYDVDLRLRRTDKMRREFERRQRAVTA